jgi:hypothetical protein
MKKSIREQEWLDLGIEPVETPDGKERLLKAKVGGQRYLILLKEPGIAPRKQAQAILADVLESKKTSRGRVIPVPQHIPGPLSEERLIRAGSIPVENFPEVRKWLEANQLKVLKSRLTGDNRKTFAAIWGKPNCHFRGEFNHNVYHLKQGGYEFLVYTAARKGTSLEIIPGPDKSNTGKAALKFLEIMMETMNLVRPTLQAEKIPAGPSR